MNTRLIGHGLFVAIGTAIAGCLIPLFQNGVFPGQIQTLAAIFVGLIAGAVYLSKLPVFGSAGDKFTWITVLHGALVAVLTDFAGIMLPILQTGTLPDHKHLIGALIVGLCAGGTYLSKLPAIGSSATPAQQPVSGVSTDKQ